MFLAALSLLLLQDTTRAHDGRANQTSVAPPRVEATAVVDGVLDEPVWSRAARLTGFSQYQPVDGRPAEEPTEVLVWYAPDAIYFGIRARELHGNVVRATEANRDNIGSEDQIQILLDTYNDRRLAFLFGVNPLGVQQDGTRSDNFGGGAGGRFQGGGGVGAINPLEGNVDLNPDFIFDSKGRLVEGGYEVEIRIPFKSLRYQEGREQTWGINVLRRVQHSGFQDSWTPAVRANASFLGQSGALVGLRDLHRGLVLEVTPTAVGRADGSRASDGSWDYDASRDVGADVRWGIKQNLSLNGTVNPDFSQVEADVGQVVLNERFALFFPEKRPFFLDGLELFDTPNQLIYTRRIVDPKAGVKLAGKIGSANVGTLIAADNEALSATGSDTPIFGIARVRRDLGRNSTLGGVFTTRESGSDYSRLVGGDLRLYHSKLYFVELQAVQSWTADQSGARSGPLFQATWDRTGRTWGFHYNVQAVAPEFEAAAGFVNRTGVINGNLFNRLSVYGSEGSFLQTGTAFVSVSRVWRYSEPGMGPIEGTESIFPSATLRGGWLVNGSIAHGFFDYLPEDYGSYAVERATGAATDTTAFTVPGTEGDQWTARLGVTTPTFRHFTATVSASLGRTPIFLEAAPGSYKRLDVVLDLRPTAALRGAFQLTRYAIDRRRDGSEFSSETIPRLKLEYQLSRAIFFRFVGQYAARKRAPAEDRNGDPILIGGVKDPGATTNDFTMDWLFSYRPIPGTLVYLGYGSASSEPEQFRFRDLRRNHDGFFAKLSYLFRM
ncbi:MAG: DUF5916 domain-containing protein [Gemmatimonadales bacterium]